MGIIYGIRVLYYMFFLDIFVLLNLIYVQKSIYLVLFY